MWNVASQEKERHLFSRQPTNMPYMSQQALQEKNEGGDITAPAGADGRLSAAVDARSRPP